MKQRRRRSSDRRPQAVRTRAASNGDSHVASPTAVAAEALRTGVLPTIPRRRDELIPAEAETILVGDPDDHCLANEYVGEETPGGTSPTPDQNGVDEIGRAYGLQEEDTGPLRSAGEILSRRDRHRMELQAPRKPQP
jgi:hypothetical protein